MKSSMGESKIKRQRWRCTNHAGSTASWFKLTFLVVLIARQSVWGLRPIEPRQTHRPMVEGLSRRAILLTVMTSWPASSSDALVYGSIKVMSTAIIPASDAAALYITLRKGAAIDATASLVRANPQPAIAAVKVPISAIKFPVDFTITTADLFPDVSAIAPGTPITISARLDADGIAATRGPEDLVASAYGSVAAQTPVDLLLQPRGFVTKLMR